MDLSLAYLTRIPVTAQSLRNALMSNDFSNRWVREFLNEENKGLDVLVEYLSFAQYAVTWVRHVWYSGLASQSKTPAISTEQEGECQGRCSAFLAELSCQQLGVILCTYLRAEKMVTLIQNHWIITSCREQKLKFKPWDCLSLRLYWRIF